jgi:hypothetical protein
VHVETLYGRSPGELVTLAKNMADRVAFALPFKASKYVCTLGKNANLQFKIIKKGSIIYIYQSVQAFVLIQSSNVFI